MRDGCLRSQALTALSFFLPPMTPLSATRALLSTVADIIDVSFSAYCALIGDAQSTVRLPRAVDRCITDSFRSGVRPNHPSLPTLSHSVSAAETLRSAVPDE